MIYTASLNVPVKKALGKQVMQSTLNKICDQIGIDPDTTNMDVVILGPRDLVGPKAPRVQQALKNCHPDICVIYIYEKAEEANLIDCEYKKQCKKIKPADITAAFEEFVGEHKVRQGKQQVSSADFEAQPKLNKTDSIGPRVAVPTHSDYGEYGMPGDDEVEEPSAVMQQMADTGSSEQSENEVPPLNIPPINTEQYTEAEKVPLDTQPEMSNPLTQDPSEIPEIKPVQTVEQSLANITSYEDWSIMKEHLNHDSVVKQLIAENSEYVGLVNMLDVLDKRIETVWRDSALSPEQKFEKIKEIGLERSVVRATTNSINVEKVISIISTIVLSAKRTVDEKIQSLDVALYKISTDKAQIMDTSYIDKAICERTKVQLELLNISRGIVDLYKSIDTLVVKEIDELDRKLPSSNQFINEMVQPIGTQIFTPANTAVLANKLMKALQENSVVASQLEESVNAVIDNLFALCEKDEEIIRYQQNMINMLKAHRVEDVIITNTLLKKVLRLYVGADNTGRSATAITWCGILSRRQNSLLIDLTGRDKFREYGITPMRLDDFMTSRTEQNFLCVASDHIPAPEELQEIVTQLKSRLNYYPYVNIILAPEDTNGLQQLSDEALCVHYITDCSTSSIKTMKEVVANHTAQNIAHKLITIDTPVSPLMIADSIGIDPTMTKVISLPNVPAIRACSLRHDRPYEFNDVVKVFEEAFR